MRAIVASCFGNGIGNEGKLLFRNSDDMAMFRKLTTGGTVIMGRKTFESIGHPLSDRRNIVLSQTLPKETEGVEVCFTIQDVLDIAPEDAWVIGGGKTYGFLWDHIDTIVKTTICTNMTADTWFPDTPKKEWISMYTSFKSTEGIDDSTSVDLYQQVLWRRDKYGKTQNELAELIADTYQYICMTERDATVWAAEVFTLLIDEGFYRLQSNMSLDRGNNLIQATRYAHETWVMIDAILCEKYPAHPPSELALLVYVDTFRDHPNVEDPELYHLAATTVLQEVMNRPDISAICSIADIKDNDLLREFFTAFADLGTIYKDPRKYSSTEHRKKQERLMAIYHRMANLNQNKE